MTEAEFDVIADLIGSRDKARVGAKLILVFGKGPAEAAREAGLAASQSAWNAAHRIRAAEEKILQAYVPLRGKNNSGTAGKRKS